MIEVTFLLIGIFCGAVLGYALARRSRRPETLESNLSEGPREVTVVDERDDLVDEVLERLSEGVLVFNELMRPVLSNGAAQRLLQLGEGESVPVEILSIVRRAVAGPEIVDEIIDVWIGGRASLRVRAIPLEEHGGVILTLEDVTDEQRVQRVRRQFVTHASHELKSPVASIQALAEVLDDAAANDPSRVASFASRLREETRRLARLVEDLLDLSRVEDPASFSDTPTDLGEVADGEVERARSAAQAKRLTLSHSIEEEVLVRGDDRQLALLVRNLLDNAIRYTPEGGSVQVELIRGDDEGVLRVVDTGVGIPLRSQARVFERFYRVDEGRSREQGGTGLGLAIVKHIADLHGGRVEVESVYGEGSTFTARLPLMNQSVARASG